jgi:hypothetical protein
MQAVLPVSTVVWVEKHRFTYLPELSSQEISIGKILI